MRISQLFYSILPHQRKNNRLAVKPFLLRQINVFKLTTLAPNTLILSALLLCQLLVQPAVYASNQSTLKSCLALDDIKRQPDCLAQIKAEVEKKLTLWQNNQLFALMEAEKATGRRDVLKVFKRAQKEFIDYRESHCRWRYLKASSIELSLIAYQRCFIELTQHRIEEITE